VIRLESFLISVPHGFIEVFQVVGIELCVEQGSSGTCSMDAGFEACHPGKGKKEEEGREKKERKERGKGRFNFNVLCM
jgi:hypothetical protein